jgi:hypothetical protein
MSSSRALAFLSGIAQLGTVEEIRLGLHLNSGPHAIGLHSEVLGQPAMTTQVACMA